MREKILIVGPSWVGDMMMAQSLFKILADRGHQVDVLAPGWSLPLLSRMPEVTNAILMPIGHGRLALRERWKIAKDLQRNHYTQSIVLPNSLKSALIPWFAKIPKRTGWRGEWRYGLLNDVRVLDKQSMPKLVQRYVALANPSSAENLSVIPEPLLQTTQDLSLVVIQKFGISSTKKRLALCPGAEFGPAKRWPEKYYADVALHWLNKGWSIMLLGSEKDKSVCKQINSLTNHQCLDLAGVTSLNEAVEILGLADKVVSNDSGLMHIAAALNKPLTAIYGPTSEHYTPPLNTNAAIVKTDVPCRPCFARTCPLKHHVCMETLKPEQVIQMMELQ